MKKVVLTIFVLVLLLGFFPCFNASAKKGKSEEKASEETVSADENKEETEESKEEATDTAESEGEDEGKSEAYKDIKDKVWNNTDETLAELMEGAKETGRNITDGIWKYVFYMYDVVSAVYPGVFFFSILIGSVVAVMSSKNKKVRKRAIVIGIITIPVVLTAVVYILPYIYIRLS
jgi:hypothetical protein